MYCFTTEYGCDMYDGTMIELSGGVEHVDFSSFGGTKVTLTGDVKVERTVPDNEVNVIRQLRRKNGVEHQLIGASYSDVVAKILTQLKE